MPTDTLAPPATEPTASLSPKDFRGVYTRVSKLLEPLSTADRRRVLVALNSLLGEP